MNIRKARDAKNRKMEKGLRAQAFVPCIPDMTICGDCEDNREKNKCPRLKEWREKRNS